MKRLAVGEGSLLAIAPVGPPCLARARDRAERHHIRSDAVSGEWPPGYPEDRRAAYDLASIRKWLEVFLRRFFAFSQFKRSAMPNGPKVSAGGSLSPRGDWRAPSDSEATVWMDQLALIPDQE